MRSLSLAGWPDFQERSHPLHAFPKPLFSLGVLFDEGSPACAEVLCIGLLPVFFNIFTISFPLFFYPL